MKTFPARATRSSELLWWDLLIDNTQCWGNRLKKSFWESLVRTADSVKNDASPCRHVQDLGSAIHLADDANTVGKMSSIRDATCTAFGDRIRKLFPEVHGGLANVFRPALIQERSINSGVESRFFASGISADLYSRSSGRDDGTHPCFRKGASGDDAALCIQSQSAIEAASKLVSAFAEICAKHEDLEEASFVIDMIYKQLLSITNATGSMQKRSCDIGSLGDKLSFFTPCSWTEQGGSKKNEINHLSILKPFDRIGLVKFGMLLHNHVISNDLEANVCFWSALTDLYAEGGMRMDAHGVLKSLDGSLAVPSRAQIEGCARLGECFNCMQHEGEQPNDSMHTGLLPYIHNGCSAEGQCGFQGAKHFLIGTNPSRTSACLREINVLGRSMPTASFISRAFSTSTEKQCDEDVGEQESPIQYQSSSQQQSSLELPESKPQSSSSWPNPDNAASYVLMSNIYADGDRWDEVKRINEMRLKARAWKKPGKAYVEIKAKVHEFIVGDRTHQESVNIYEKLRKIKRHMGHIGYVPNVDLVVENRSHYDPYAKR